MQAYLCLFTFYVWNIGIFPISENNILFKITVITFISCNFRAQIDNQNQVPAYKYIMFLIVNHLGAS